LGVGGGGGFFGGWGRREVRDRQRKNGVRLLYAVPPYFVARAHQPSRTRRKEREKGGGQEAYLMAALLPLCRQFVGVLGTGEGKKEEEKNFRKKEQNHPQRGTGWSPPGQSPARLPHQGREETSVVAGGGRKGRKRAVRERGRKGGDKTRALPHTGGKNQQRLQKLIDRQDSKRRRRRKGLEG